jgi:inner membrane protein
METSENRFQWIRTSISLKLVVIGFLVIILLIPSVMIGELVRERQSRMHETEEEVKSKWGNEQSVSGLILTVPCEYAQRDDKGKIISVSTSYLNILPDQMVVRAHLIPETRYRGIFKVTVYRSVIDISGAFDSIKADESITRDRRILWNEAFVVAGITDPRGIKENVVFSFNRNKVPARPGTMGSEVFKTGISAPLAVNEGQKIDFNYRLYLNGSGLFSVLPMGMETQAVIRSEWAHPQFDGAFLPDHRRVSDSGFVADWKILEHNRNIPQQSFGEINLENTAFGVQLIKPVDIYQTSERAVKYSMLFIILTFLVFFFTEVLVKKSAHPIQYLMAGVALCVFFSLLIALSEHTGFNLAYLIASTVIILMITLYTQSVFKHRKVSLTVMGVLVALFAFLFVALQLEDYALLFGNIGLVVILGVVMWVSRKVDWYRDKKEIETE